MNLEADYMDSYKASMKEMIESPGYIEMDALCWHVFSTADGQKLLEVFKDKIIYQGTQAKIDPSYPTTCVYMEGYRAAFRYLVEMVNAYQSKKDYEAKKVEHDS